jgi:hypothetical protein
MCLNTTHIHATGIVSLSQMHDSSPFACIVAWHAGYSAGVMSVAWCGVHEHQLAAGDGSGELRLFDIRRAGTLHTFDLSEASLDSENDQYAPAVSKDSSSTRYAMSNMPLADYTPA